MSMVNSILSDVVGGIVGLIITLMIFSYLWVIMGVSPGTQYSLASTADTLPSL